MLPAHDINRGRRVRALQMGLALLWLLRNRCGHHSDSSRLCCCPEVPVPHLLMLLSPGHEAAFAAFLCCLCKLGVLRVDDQLGIVFRVFNR